MVSSVVNFNTLLPHCVPTSQQQTRRSDVVERRLVCAGSAPVYAKYSVNRSSYRPLVRVSQPLHRSIRPTTRAVVRAAAHSQVSEDELSSGHSSCTHAVTNTKLAAARRL